MDTRLLEAYNRELGFVRDMAAEFAAEHPAIAAGLGLAGAGPQDPYVERLLEGCAFLAARTQLKLDARHPQFTQALLEIVYPGFVSPIPACAIAELVPNVKEAALASGVSVPRGSELRALERGERTACQFRTAHEVVLWPLEMSHIAYVSGSGALGGQGLGLGAEARAALRLQMQVPEGIELAQLPLDALTFYVACEAPLAARLMEQVTANCIGGVVRTASREGTGIPGRPIRLEASAIAPAGCEDEEALLPLPRAGFQGYRLLQEYFAFPERLRFFRVSGLREAIRASEGRTLEIFVVFDRSNPALENVLGAGSVRLHCTPVVNLFPKTLDRVHVSVTDTEMLVTADRNRPMDFEIHSLTAMRGIGGSGEVLTEVLPLYRTRIATREDPIFYSVQRRPRLKSLRQKQTGARAQYLGSEVFVSLADRSQRHFTGELRQLDIDALCTNRDLAAALAFEPGESHFALESSAPVESIRCIAGPSAPRNSPAFGDAAWRLIGHLTLNYLALRDASPAAGAQTLRGLLELYADPLSPVARRQVEGVRSVRYEPVVRRVPAAGPIAYGRGLEITVSADDAAFEGLGIAALGAVLERFFARYASINSFTQLRLESTTRGEIKRWPPRIGQRQSL